MVWLRNANDANDHEVVFFILLSVITKQFKKLSNYLSNTDYLRLTSLNQTLFFFFFTCSLSLMHWSTLSGSFISTLLSFRGLSSLRSNSFLAFLTSARRNSDSFKEAWGTHAEALRKNVKCMGTRFLFVQGCVITLPCSCPGFSRISVWDSRDLVVSLSLPSGPHRVSAQSSAAGVGRTRGSGTSASVHSPDMRHEYKHIKQCRFIRSEQCREVSNTRMRTAWPV